MPDIAYDTALLPFLLSTGVAGKTSSEYTAAFLIIFMEIMKAYIAVNFNKRDELKTELDCLVSLCGLAGIEAWIFAEQYFFSPEQEKEMMQQATTDIQSCDLLIAEASNKAIGVGIEAGYAKACKKTVVYMRKAGAAHSTTLSGISDYSIIYKNLADLQAQLGTWLKQFRKQS